MVGFEDMNFVHGKITEEFRNYLRLRLFVVDCLVTFGFRGSHPYEKKQFFVGISLIVGLSFLSAHPTKKLQKHRKTSQPSHSIQQRAITVAGALSFKFQKIDIRLEFRYEIYIFDLLDYQTFVEFHGSKVAVLSSDEIEV